MVISKPHSSRNPSWVRFSIGGASALFIGMGLGRFSYTPMIPLLINNSGFSPAEAGYIGAFNLAGFLLGVLLQPTLKSRFGEQGTLRLCLITSWLSLLASAMPLGTPWLFIWLITWRGLIGIAVGTIMVQALALATRAAPPEKLGLATGIVFTGVGGGIFLSGSLIPYLMVHGLTVTWLGIAGLGGLATAIGLWAYSAKTPTDIEHTFSPTTYLNFKTQAAISLIAAQSLFVIGLIPHTIFWVDYLVRGLEQPISIGGFHWALFGLGALIGTTLWGCLADRIGFRLGLILIFTSLAFGLIAPVLHPVATTLIASSIIVGAQPGCSALLSGRVQQVFGPADMPYVWRRMTLVGSIGQGVCAYLFVGIFDYTGSYLIVFLLGGAAMAAGALIFAITKRP